jgi:hypothetical protein
MLTFLGASAPLSAYHMPAAGAPDNCRYTRLDYICSDLFGIQKHRHKNAPTPKDERAFFRSCDAA